MDRREFLKRLLIGTAAVAVVPVSMLIADKGGHEAPRDQYFSNKVTNDLTMESLRAAREDIQSNKYLTDPDQWYMVEDVDCEWHHV